MRHYQLKIHKSNSFSQLTENSWKIMKRFKTVLNNISTGCKIKFSSFKGKQKSNFSKQLTDCKINTNKTLITWMINSIRLEELINNKLINLMIKSMHWEDKTIFLRLKTEEYKANIRKFLSIKKKLLKCWVKKLFLLNQPKISTLNITLLQWKKLSKMPRQSFMIFILPFLKKILNLRSLMLNWHSKINK